MSKLIQTSKVRVQKEPGNSKIKSVEIEGFPGKIRMGVHGGIAKYFKLSPDEPMASTLDYIVAAVGRLHDRYGRRVPLRRAAFPADPDKLQVEAEGKIEDVDGKMILTGIKLHYRLKVPAENAPPSSGHWNTTKDSARLRKACEGESPSSGRVKLKTSRRAMPSNQPLRG